MSDKAEATEATTSPAAVSKVNETAPAQVESKTTEPVDSANGVANPAASAEEQIGEVSKHGDDASSAKKESSTAKEDDRKRNGDYERKPRYDDRRGDRHNGRHGRDDRRKKPKTNEYDDLPETDDPVEIRKQVEFYFSLQNLRTDEHMFLEMDGPKNRPVSVKHIHSFKRMKRFQPYTAVVAALRDSPELEVVDDGDFAGAGNEAVKRKSPIEVPAEEGDEKRPPSTEDLFYRQKKLSRNALEASVYVKDFGPEEQAGQIALERFFQPYGAVMVRKRREQDDNSWKGSVFVEFDSEDSAKQFVELDPKPTYNGNELFIMSKKEYSEMKCKEKGITPEWERGDNGRDHPRRGGFRGARGGRGGRDRGRDRGRGRGRGGRRDNDRRRRDRSNSRGSDDSRDWNDRRDKFQKSKDFHGGRRQDRASSRDRDGNPKDEFGRTVDDNGVPVIQDTRKRKADEGKDDSSPKKTKFEIKEDS